jgi:hypothetical protein
MNSKFSFYLVCAIISIALIKGEVEVSANDTFKEFRLLSDCKVSDCQTVP